MRHKLGLYIRVSTEEQAQVIEGSLESQKHRLQGFVDIKNMQEASWGKIIETYIDEGLSAKDTKRPAFQRMMKDIRGGKINLILVTDLSRLSRNIMDFCILLEDLKKANAKFLSLKEQFDTSTPAGEMMVFNMINLAQFERKQTSERVSMNFHARAVRGLRNGGGIVLGFDKDPTNPSKLLINEDEAPQVREIFKTYRELCSLSQTMKRIEELGIRPKSREIKKDRHNLAGRWTTQTLLAVLRNYAYAGLREVNAKNKNKDPESLKFFERYQIVKASWPAMVDEADFQLVQKILDANLSQERKRLASAQTRTFLLTGVIYCEECGRPMVGSSGHGKNKTHRYYVHRPIQGEPVTCAVKTVAAEPLEQEILKHLDEVLFREGYLDALERRYASAYSQSHADYRTEKVKKESELIQVEKEIRSAIRLHAELASDGVDDMLKDTLRALKDQKSSIETRLKELEDILENSKSAAEDRNVIELNAHALKKAKAKANPAVLKRIIQRTISAIAITPQVAKVGYWSCQQESPISPSENKIPASGENSQAGIVVPFGTRKLVKIQNFEKLPPLPLAAGDEKVFCGYIVRNGRGDRI